jgi:predicted DNA-binding transcriptional regulator AlpA
MAIQVHCVNGRGNRPAPSLQSVPAFCTDNGVSRSLFYRLIKEGRGPRVTKVARRTLISAESAAEWRARMERETEQSAHRSRATEGRRRGTGHEPIISGGKAA